jgi:murein DD-endopeptidase MepM/ murein hydrolase activator NlpD
MKVVFIVLICLVVGRNVSSQVYSINGFEKIHRNLDVFKPYMTANELCYPVSHGNMDGYIVAQEFGRFYPHRNTYHLGADITSPVPGNEDMGDTLYSIGNGIVITVWSNVVMILHKTPYYFIVSQYRHTLENFVKEGEYVKIRQSIATIGNDNGIYQAHLHFEIRTDINLEVEGGYGNKEGYLEPMGFIQNFNRIRNGTVSDK